MINILFTSFAGLGLPRTVCIAVPDTTSILDLTSQLVFLLPDFDSRLIFTTNTNRELPACSKAPISSLLPDCSNAAFLPLRLSVPLRGGKGGFGSQLRAAGGRMASRKRKNQGENNGSSRNLDGRRLRTVTEAKALAEYLALKPEMEKKEKETRRKRWEQVVELAESKEEEIRNGSRGRVDGKWVEDKEETGERTREAVLVAMRFGIYTDNSFAEELPKANVFPNKDAGDDMSGSSGEDVVEKTSSKATTSLSSKGNPPARFYFGFDDDDDALSEEGKEAEAEELVA